MNTDQLSPYLRHDDITVTVEDGKGGPSYAEIIDDAGIMAAVKYKLVQSRYVDSSTTKITTKIKSTYMYSNNVDSSDIAVNTTKGVVTLDGMVDSGSEKALAVQLAENIKGVQSVKAGGLTFK